MIDILQTSTGDVELSDDLIRTVRKQCERDGMRVDAIDYDTDGTLTISAEYDDSNS